MSDTFQNAVRLIEAAVVAEDLFGSTLTPADLKKKYRALAIRVHPDTHPDTFKLAQDTTAKLNALRDDAEARLASKTYGNRRPAEPEPEPFTITTKKHTYTANTLLRHGDVADTYDGVLEDKTPVDIRIVHSSRDNDLVENESKVLGHLFDASSRNHFLPEPIESFVVKSSGNRRVSITDSTKALHTLADILVAYPHGVDFRDGAWMFNRMLEAAGYIHRRGVIHGAFVPTSITFDVKTHGAKVIDWYYAVHGKQSIKAVVKDYRSYYPPEVFDKRSPSAATDIYMIAKCMVALLGGDSAKNLLPAIVPERIRSFIQSCLFARPTQRPDDAWALREEHDTVLAALVGARKFRPFQMPAR